jgi:multiple sugar transport system substrate-binding protein
MNKSRKMFGLTLISLLVILSLLAACTPTAPEVTEAPASQPSEKPDVPETEEVKEDDPAEEPVAEAPADERDFITWFQYDQNNTDPSSDERVGNMYLNKTIPEFNEDFDGKWNWINVPKAWDKIFSELVAAVLAGGDVPDMMYAGSSDLPTLVQNGAVQDLRAWAEIQSWWKDLDPNAITACTGPDGGLYCLPIAETPHLTYIWTDHFPNGWPKTPDEFMVEAERLKNEGVSALTFFGSTAYGGDGATRAVYTVISSFGGSYSDNEGNMTLNTPEVVAAVEFLRDIVAKGYVTETTFAGSFMEEESFKDASGAAIPTGLFGYRYINPLTAPDGTKYDKGSSDDMLDAIAAGDVKMVPFFAPEGKTPGCNNVARGFVIPVGAQNVEAVYDYINWLMTDADRNAEFVVGPAAGFPSLLSVLDHEVFQVPFYQVAKDAITQASCSPYYGTLERPAEAKELIMNTIYKLIRENPEADIATELQKAQDEYNSGN